MNEGIKYWTQILKIKTQLWWTHSTTMTRQTQNVITNIILPLKKHPKSLSWYIQLFAHFSYLYSFLLTFHTYATFCSLFILLQLFAHFSYFYNFLLTFHTFAAFRGSAITRLQIAHRDTLLCRRCFGRWGIFLLFEKYQFLAPQVL